MELQLSGRVAWITGASGGIGRVIASALAAEGAVIAISGRNAATLDALADDIEAGSRVRPFVAPVDLASTASVNAAVDAILARHERIELVVNSATAPIVGPFEQLTDEDWETVLQTKYLGYVRVLRAVLPHMARRGFGRVVNISGGGGKRPGPLHLPGGGTNAAVNHLSKGLADIYGKNGIRINTVSPGPVESERLRMIVRSAADAPQAGVSAAALVDGPLGRPGAPEEIADAVLYLLSERSSFITGTVLTVDGGRLPTV